MKKIALITAFVIGTGSAAMAFDFDPNLANRYPAYATPHGQVLTTAPVAMGKGQSIAKPSQTVDRASNPNAGGV